MGEHTGPQAVLTGRTATVVTRRDCPYTPCNFPHDYPTAPSSAAPHAHTARRSSPCSCTAAHQRPTRPPSHPPTCPLPRRPHILLLAARLAGQDGTLLAWLLATSHRALWLRHLHRHYREQARRHPPTAAVTRDRSTFTCPLRANAGRAVCVLPPARLPVFGWPATTALAGCRIPSTFNVHARLRAIRVTCAQTFLPYALLRQRTRVGPYMWFAGHS